MERRGFFAAALGGLVAALTIKSAKRPVRVSVWRSVDGGTPVLVHPQGHTTNLVIAQRPDGEFYWFDTSTGKRGDTLTPFGSAGKFTLWR